MAQSALTVTPPNPTPPTNMACTGATGPNPPNFSRAHYAEPFGARDAQGAFTDETPPGVRVNPNPPPYFDDGAAGSLTLFATNTAALAGGTSAADNAGVTPGFIGTASAGAGGTGTNNTSGSYPGATNGLVPASTSVPHEAAGTEVVVTSPGSLATAPTQQVSVFGAYTSTPNASHASYLSAGTAPVITGLSAGGVSGVGTTSLTVTGTGFTRAAVVYVSGVAQNTNYVSATSLTVAGAPKKLTAGTSAVTVINGVGGTPSNSFNWTFT